MKIKLFTISAEGNLAINTHELLAIDSFRTIVKRDINKDRVLAFKELAYIYYTTDYDSPLVRQGLSIAKLKKQAKDKVGLPVDWKEDDVVKKGIEDYGDLQEDVARKAVKDILDLFGNYSKIIQQVKVSLDAYLDNKTGLTKDQAVEALNLIKVTLTVAKEIPGEMKSLKESLRELEKDSYIEDRDKLRGTDDIIPSSANAHEDY